MPLTIARGPMANKTRGASRCKVHPVVDEATPEVRAVEITESRVGDAPMLPGLLSQIPEGERVASVTIDGAHDGRASRPAATLSPGRRAALGRERGSRPRAPSSASAGCSGGNGP